MKPVYLVKGSDPGLVGRALKDLLGRLADGAHVEEFWPEASGEASGDSGEPGEGGGRAAAGRFELGRILDACQTPAFLFDRRLIVVRRAGCLDASQAKRLAEYLTDPLPSTTLVFVAEDKAVPAALDKAVKAAGEIVDVATPSNAGGRKSWVEGELKRSGITLDREARGLLDTTLGEDVTSLPNLLTNLVQAYGQGAGTLGVGELAPFLGESGSVAPWALTDAIDGGDIARAVDALHRLSGAGDRHALGILPSLHRHFGGMLALDGLSVDEGDAARLLGMSPFPAGKLLRQGRKMGYERIATAITLLADADLDLRGRTDLPTTAIMEVLVARLARLSGEVKSASLGGRARAGTARSR